MNWWLEQWDRELERQGVDPDTVSELPDFVVARILDDEMRAPGYDQRCHRRGCGHTIAKHDSNGCTAVGCDCEGLKP